MEVQQKKKLSPDQLELLKKPLPKEASKPHPTKTYLSTIKAIYVVERLNEVFGIGGWKIWNVPVREGEKWVVVKSTFEAEEYGIVIPDIFGGNDNADLGDAYKGACTDALTKIGSYLGIGMDIYKGLADKAKPEEKKPAPAAKPLISVAQYKQLIDRVDKGEIAAYAKAITMFRFTDEQLMVLEEKHSMAKQIKDGLPA